MRRSDCADFLTLNTFTHFQSKESQHLFYKIGNRNKEQRTIALVGIKGEVFGRKMDTYSAGECAKENNSSNLIHSPYGRIVCCDKLPLVFSFFYITLWRPRLKLSIENYKERFITYQVRSKNKIYQ